MTFDQMRISYTKSGLSETDLTPDPIGQFLAWFKDAHTEDRPSWLETNAMTLSTSDPATGRVTSRIVLLKGVEDKKFIFFTNYLSEKGRQMEANPQISLCFFWPHLERQVRIVGRVAKTSRQASVEYFAQRPRGSRLGANVSSQSQVVPDRSRLEAAMRELDAKYADRDDIPCPENWGGYAVTPSEIEFWQGRDSRLHDRLVYRREGDAWKIVRLAP
jgi:pyridoxamine-phosphate oxidase